MALASIPTCPPQTIFAGDSEVWDDLGFSNKYGSYSSSDGWTLSYALLSMDSEEQPGAKVAPTSVPQGNGWRTTLTAAQTDQLWGDGTDAEGRLVKWVARVTDGTYTQTVATGEMRLLPNSDNLASGFTSTTKERLDKAEEALSRGILSYTISGRSVTYASAEALGKHVARLRYQWWCEQNPGQLMPAAYGRFTEAR